MSTFQEMCNAPTYEEGNTVALEALTDDETRKECLNWIEAEDYAIELYDIFIKFFGENEHF